MTNQLIKTSRKIYKRKTINYTNHINPINRIIPF